MRTYLKNTDKKKYPTKQEFIDAVFEIIDSCIIYEDLSDKLLNGITAMNFEDKLGIEAFGRNIEEVEKEVNSIAREKQTYF